MARLKTVQQKDETRFLISGRLDGPGASHVWATFSRQTPHTRVVVFDLAQVSYINTAGAVVVNRMQQSLQQQGVGSVKIEHLSAAHQQMISHIRENTDNRHRVEPPQSLSFVENSGRLAAEFLLDTKELITYTGRITFALFQSVKQPHHIRWSDTLFVAEKAGVNALPIVALISFIVGLVMAFQAAIPMKMFGAELYVANLIGISMVRELAPLMTAIVLAGRSASAFAAEIGTMQINEEIDALDVMGIDPFRFLIVPRVIALTFITPLLTVFSNLMGMLGGAVVITGMGYPVISYYNQIAAFVQYRDFAGGMLKCVVFGLLIAATGCIRGYQTASGPSAVGVSTTRAVVTSIVLIAVFDAVFSIVYYFLGI